MAMGLPVVATDVPGIRGVVQPGRNGLLVPPGDPAEFRQALLAITKDESQYRGMSAASRQLAARYSWDAIRPEFLRLYAGVSAGRPGGGSRS
jgi:glycosyltransferase involved in cell wall biosynthesis